VYLIANHVAWELNQQQRFAEARRDSAARAVALVNGKSDTRLRRLLRFGRPRRARDVGPHDFRYEGEDLMKAMRF